MRKRNNSKIIRILVFENELPPCTKGSSQHFKNLTQADEKILCESEAMEKSDRLIFAAGVGVSMACFRRYQFARV
jgi:hypothetical protein